MSEKPLLLVLQRWWENPSREELAAPATEQQAVVDLHCMKPTQAVGQRVLRGRVWF